MNETFRLGRIAGVRVGANWTVVLIAGLIAWVLATRILPGSSPDRPPAEYWAVGIAAAALFFVSLLAHELAHAVQARREGIAVEGVTLWLLGGVAHLKGQARTPGAEARVAGVGPLVSLGLGVLFGLAALGAQAVGAAPLLVDGAAWLGGINLVLGIFNLLPGAPLDGGRLLRAAVWRWRGNALKATQVATSAGRGLGFALIAFGLFELVAGGDAGGAWTVIIGFFLVSAAAVENTQAVLSDALADVPVRAVMDDGLLRVPGGLRLDTFATHVAMAQRASAYLVSGPGGEVVGVVALAQIARVPAAERRDRRLDEIAVPLERMPAAHPDELVVRVLERLAPGSPGVLVMDAGQAVGFLGPREIAEAVEKAKLVGAGRPAGADRSSEVRRPS